MKTKIGKIQGAFFSIAGFMIILTMLTGCRFYYKVQTSNNITSGEFKTYQSDKKYFILHTADTAWHLSNIILDDNSFSGTLTPLPKAHQKYKYEKGKFRYRRETASDSSYVDESNIVNEVHLFYTGDSLRTIGNNVTGYISSIKKVDVYKKNIGKTTWSWLWPPLVVAAPFAIITLLIIAAAASIGG
jgi:hypothetical protein